jgi:hypothetical protein
LSRFLVSFTPEQACRLLPGNPSFHQKVTEVGQSLALCGNRSFSYELNRCRGTEPRLKNTRSNHRISRFLPGRDPAFDNFDVFEALFLVGFRHTGGSVFDRSGAIEDNLLVLAQRIFLRLEFP